jgi:hypothetical protein
VNHGPFYRSAELIAGFRTAHAAGRIYAGTLTAAPVANGIRFR